MIITIPKGGDPSVTTNYRGISLLSCTLKVLTIILNIRLSKWLQHRNIFVKEQLGFRDRMSVFHRLQDWLKFVSVENYAVCLL